MENCDAFVDLKLCEANHEHIDKQAFSGIRACEYLQSTTINENANFLTSLKFICTFVWSLIPPVA